MGNSATVVKMADPVGDIALIGNIYFSLRFGLANAINDY